MSRHGLAKVPPRLWLGLGVAVLMLVGVWVALPLSAFAGESVKLVSASGTTTANTQTVTMKCPGGTTAVGVTADIKGPPGISINGLMPQGRHAFATASRTSVGVGPWTLKAQALCVRKTADISYVSGSGRASPGADTQNTYVTCPDAKELIGFGWSVDPTARVWWVFTSGSSYGDGGGTGGDGTSYDPPGSGDTGYDPPGSGDTGYDPPGSGDTGSSGPERGTYASGLNFATYATANTRQGWSQSMVGVCATRGHGTRSVVGSVASAGTTLSTSAASCPTSTQIHALNFYVSLTSDERQAIRQLKVSPDARTGTLGVLNLGPPGPYGPAGALVIAFCAAT